MVDIALLFRDSRLSTEYVRQYGDWSFVIKALRDGDPSLLSDAALRGLIADKLEGKPLLLGAKKFKKKYQYEVGLMISYVVAGGLIDGVPLYNKADDGSDTIFERVKANAIFIRKNDETYGPGFNGLGSIESFKEALKMTLARMGITFIKEEMVKKLMVNSVLRREEILGMEAALDNPALMEEYNNLVIALTYEGARKNAEKIINERLKKYIAK